MEKQTQAPDWNVLGPEMLKLLQAMVEGRPLREPPKEAVIAHRNWSQWMTARDLIARATAKQSA